MFKQATTTFNILSDIDFGSDVAEKEKYLADFFVSTSDFEAIVNDKFDLILGPKGSRKSSIFQQLANEDVEIPHIADVDILPDLNAAGGILFRKLLAIGYRSFQAAPARTKMATPAPTTTATTAPPLPVSSDTDVDPCATKTSHSAMTPIAVLPKVRSCRR